MAVVPAPIPMQLNKEMKFAARRVPDFAKLHALEDARLARWKREHKKDVTVPLNFRLANAPTSTNAMASNNIKQPQHYNVNGPSQGSSRSKSVSVPNSARSATAGDYAGQESKSKQRDRVPQLRSDMQKENENIANTATAGVATRLLPAEPTNTHARMSSTGRADSIGGARPFSAPPQSNRPTVVSTHSPSTQSSSDASRDQTAVSIDRQNLKPEGFSDLGMSRAGTSTSEAEPKGYSTPAQSDSPHHSGAAVVANSVATTDRPRDVDIEQLRRIIGTLREDTTVQPFSSMDFYFFGKTLGQGAYGKVKLGLHYLTGEKVAVKTFEKSKLTEAHARKRVSREIRILKALNHPYIIKLYEVVDVPLRKYLIMQFSSGGDLCRYVRENRRLSEQEACRLFCQIVEGLQYCHLSGIVHRDVKLDNLLIDDERNIKIVDFGFSVSFKEGQKLRKACGSPSYAAPEIVARRPYSPTGVDVWSLGVVLYAMICGYFPFQGSSNQDLCRRIVKGKFECPPFMSTEVRDLVKKMLNVDAVKRITLREIQEHSWCRAAFLKMEPANVTIRPIECEESDSSVAAFTNDAEQGVQVEVDEATLDQVASLGFLREYATRVVSRNQHNQCCATYWLLYHRREAQRKAARAAAGEAPSQPSQGAPSAEPPPATPALAPTPAAALTGGGSSSQRVMV